MASTPRAHGTPGLKRRVSWWEPADSALVFRADDARVFVRQTPRWRALIAKHEIPVTFSFTVEAGTATHLLERRPAASPVADCMAAAPRSPGVRARAHEGRARCGQCYDRALATPAVCPRRRRCRCWRTSAARRWNGGVSRARLQLLDRALALDPGDVRARASQAAALEGLGRLSAALADWVEVARADAGTAVGEAAARRASARARASVRARRFRVVMISPDDRRVVGPSAGGGARRVGDAPGMPAARHRR